MDFVFLGIGIIIGIAAYKIYDMLMIINGILDVDHKKQLCRVRLVSGELTNTKRKKVVFIVNHNADIPREEQGL